MLLRICSHPGDLVDMANVEKEGITPREDSSTPDSTPTADVPSYRKTTEKVVSKRNSRTIRSQTPAMDCAISDTDKRLKEAAADLQSLNDAETQID